MKQTENDQNYKKQSTLVVGKKPYGKFRINRIRQIQSESTMERCVKHLLVMSALLAGLCSIPTERVTAQTFTVLHSFSAWNNETNSDGANPHTRLILSGNTLYGAAEYGGTNSCGTLFAISTNGTSFTNLYTFTGTSGLYSTNSDGAKPKSDFILSGNTLYGTAYYGGTNGNGTVFAIKTNGTGFTTLHSFSTLNNNTNSDGANPEGAGLILSGNTLYGMAIYGGTNGNGTVFAVNTNGMGFTVLHTFTAGSGSGHNFTNSDGASPDALIISGNILYGTTYSGGTNGNGTVFAINTNGTGFTNLYFFKATSGSNLTNNDGANPYTAALTLSGNILYGTTINGGTNGDGAIFAVNTNGTGFTTLYSFTALVSGTNSDGANPEAGFILSSNTLYGTTYYGGINGYGTVFAINTNGTGFTVLHTFGAGPGSFPNSQATNSDGAFPAVGLIISGNTLYGTAKVGGTNGNGTVFSLSLSSVRAPQLNIISSITNVILTWPTNVAGFTLQSTTNLVSTNWNTVSPAPVVVNTNNVVTNTISGTQQFFRLANP
jgi:uncharacterized repeat protein (TIGR03803 family)